MATEALHQNSEGIRDVVEGSRFIGFNVQAKIKALRDFFTLQVSPRAAREQDLGVSSLSESDMKQAPLRAEEELELAYLSLEEALSETSSHHRADDVEQRRLSLITDKDARVNALDLPISSETRKMIWDAQSYDEFTAFAASASKEDTSVSLKVDKRWNLSPKGAAQLGIDAMLQEIAGERIAVLKQELAQKGKVPSDASSKRMEYLIKVTLFSKLFRPDANDIIPWNVLVTDGNGITSYVDSLRSTAGRFRSA